MSHYQGYLDDLQGLGYLEEANRLSTLTDSQVDAILAGGRGPYQAQDDWTFDTYIAKSLDNLRSLIPQLEGGAGTESDPVQLTGGSQSGDILGTSAASQAGRATATDAQLYQAGLSDNPPGHGGTSPGASFGVGFAVLAALAAFFLLRG